MNPAAPVTKYVAIKDELSWLVILNIVHIVGGSSDCVNPDKYYDTIVDEEAE
jgi:hypothetical protein